MKREKTNKIKKKNTNRDVGAFLQCVLLLLRMRENKKGKGKKINKEEKKQKAMLVELSPEMCPPFADKKRKKEKD